MSDPNENKWKCRSRYASIYTCYFLSFCLLIISYLGKESFEKRGYVLAGKGTIRFYSEVAIQEIRNYLIIGIIMGIVGAALHIKTKFFDYKIFPNIEIPPRTAICPNCKEPHNGFQITNNKCPKCNIVVENIIGFYDRHPDKNQNI